MKNFFNKMMLFAILLNAFAFAADVREITATINKYGFLIIYNDEEVDYEEKALVFTGVGKDKYNYTSFINGTVAPREAVDEYVKKIQVDIGEDAEFGLLVYHANDEVIFVTRSKTSRFKKKINAVCYRSKWMLNYDSNVDYENEILVFKNWMVRYQITKAKEFEILPKEQLSDVIDRVKNCRDYDLLVYIDEHGVKHLITSNEDVTVLYSKKQPKKDLGNQECAQQ